MVRKIFFIFLVTCYSSIAYSQTDWLYFNENISSDTDMETIQTQHEELTELSVSPFNINTATKEQLQQLPFLSDEIIENILYYLYKYGPMLTVNELLGVEGMDHQTRRLLSSFIYVDNSVKKTFKLKVHNILKYGKHELTTRLDIPFQQKAGYADYDEETLQASPNKKYIGDPFYTNLRYRFHYSSHVYAGLTAEKDAGEPFFSSHNKKGYDSYSAYLFLSDVGCIKSLALGHYRASYGYGLVINSGNFFLNSSSDCYSMNRMGRGLSKFTSTSESSYLQGAGITYKLSRRLEASVFLSHKLVDARVDSLLITSFKTDGYHRLQSDMEKHNTATNTLIGSNLSYNGKFFEFGLTAVYNFLNRELSPTLKPYNVYYPRGKHFFNVGINYKLYFRRFVFSGETAIDKNGSLATINMLTYSPAVNTSLILINRFYDKRYSSLIADSYSQNSSVRNEAGIYIGLQTKFLSSFSFSCYADFFHFPYRRYLVDANGTNGLALMSRLSYSPNNQLSMFIKYIYKNTAKNFSSDDSETVVTPYIRQRLQFQLKYSPTEKTYFKFLLDGNRTGYYHQSPSYGWAASSSFRFPFLILHSSFLTLSASYFDTADYASRVYLYQPSVLYAFSMSSYYGNGTHTSILASLPLTSFLTLQARYSWTHYFDRTSIGSSTEEISGNNKSDLILQLRMKF